MLKNKHVWTKKRWRLVRREEALHNLSLEAGVPQLPRSTFTSMLRVFASSIGVISTLVAVCVLLLMVGWFVSAVDDFSRHVSELPMVGIAFLLSLLLLPGIPYTQHHRDMLLYPPCITELYQQLITSGKITVCDITGVESLPNERYLISYQFTPLETTEIVHGQYWTTDKSVQSGKEMAVIYLDSIYHVLL
jgi:hypothetical protein